MARVIFGQFPASVRPTPSDATRATLLAFTADLQLFACELPEAIESFAAQARLLAIPLRMALRAEALADEAASLTGTSQT